MAHQLGILVGLAEREPEFSYIMAHNHLEVKL